MIRNAKKWSRKPEKEPRNEKNKKVKCCEMANKLFIGVSNRNEQICLEMAKKQKY